MQEDRAGAVFRKEIFFSLSSFPNCPLTSVSFYKMDITSHTYTYSHSSCGLTTFSELMTLGRRFSSKDPVVPGSFFRGGRKSRTRKMYDSVRYWQEEGLKRLFPELPANKNGRLWLMPRGTIPNSPPELVHSRGEEFDPDKELVGRQRLSVAFSPWW